MLLLLDELVDELVEVLLIVLLELLEDVVVVELVLPESHGTAN